jgi:hypothetical protein
MVANDDRMPKQKELIRVKKKVDVFMVLIEDE